MERKIVSVRLPKLYIAGLDELIPKYGSRSKAVVHALRKLFQSELPVSALKELGISGEERKKELSEYEMVLKIRSGEIDISKCY